MMMVAPEEVELECSLPTADCTCPLLYGHFYLKLNQIGHNVQEDPLTVCHFVAIIYNKKCNSVFKGLNHALLSVLTASHF